MKVAVSVMALLIASLIGFEFGAAMRVDQFKKNMRDQCTKVGSVLIGKKVFTCSPKSS